jgi:flagellar protein FliS
MSAAPTPSTEYLRSAVLTATPEQLHLMLYDGAIRFATRGGEALRAGDREAAFHAFERAQLIVLEMINGIQPEANPELGDRMLALYSFVYRRLVDANVKRDEQAVDDALRVLRHQRETWVMLLEKVQKEKAHPAETGADTSAKTSAETAMPVPEFPQVAPTTRSEASPSFTASA